MQSLKHEETIEKQFERTIVQARDWLVANWRMVTLVVTVVVIIVAVAGFSAHEERMKREDLVSRLTDAIKPGTETAISDLRILVEDTQGADLAAWTRLALANRLMKDGVYEEAAQVYGKLAADPPMELVGLQCRLNQALALESAGRIAQARAAYERLSAEHPDDVIGQRAAQRLEMDLDAWTQRIADDAAARALPATTQPVTKAGGFFLESPESED